jgi:hypothetical protein
MGVGDDANVLAVTVNIAGNIRMAAGSVQTACGFALWHDPHKMKGTIVPSGRKTDMGVTVCLPLFGPPGRELEEGSALKGPQLRKLAAELHERLDKAADNLDRLTTAGWSTRVAMYDVILTRPGVQTKDEAVRRLGELGIAAEEVIIMEDVEEEEETGHA